MKRKRKSFLRGKIKMTRLYTDREMYGIEFDNRLIQLVRENPAIYDVQHPHYRRNQVRIAIWERIAFELSAPSKFVQTKWKNIRYNYLQELKSLETGIINANIRKRRFTEDLSFLQNTAQTYNMYRTKNIGQHKSLSGGGVGSDNESNSYMYPDNNASIDAYPDNNASVEGAYPDNNVSGDAFEVIEIEHSDDGDGSYNENDDYFMDNTVLNTTDIQNSTEKNPSPVNSIEKSELPTPKPPQNIDKSEISEPSASKTVKCSQVSPAASVHSNRSSPLLTPMVELANSDGTNEKKKNAPLSKEVSIVNGQVSCSDDNNPSSNASNKPQLQPTLRNARDIATHMITNTNSTVSTAVRSTPISTATDTMSNITRRKAMQTPLPVLTPINDPIELYCLSLVDSLRSMPRAERERVKYEFAKILKDAKYINES